MKYQRVQLQGNVKLGPPGPLPSELVGLDAAALADLSWSDPALGYRGQGFVLVPETLGDQKAAKLAGAALQYAIRFNAGFPCTIKGHSETLQMRDKDQLNWLIYKDSCDDGIAAGQGTQPAGLPLRTTDNSLYVLTNNEGRTLMLAMRAYGAGLMYRHWQLKDAIESAADEAAVEAIDVGSGWPVSNASV